jgi:sigma-54 dependent transcriptional regulator, acetoin dehydrogenase operon transcriptional activator AcoR
MRDQGRCEQHHHDEERQGMGFSTRGQMSTRAAERSPVTALADPHLSSIHESHERCQALGISRIEAPDHALIGRADLNVTLDRNRRLHEHAAPVMTMLYEQIVKTESMVLLTDASGIIIHAIGDDDFLGRASKVALRPGANWSEPAKGTNAVGTALVSEVPTLVHADEHFLYANHFLTCSAAPILDPRGNVLGVLDVSGDSRSYHHHTLALVKMSARMIENRWLTEDYGQGMRLHLHQRAELIGTLLEGILAVGPDGRIIGANRGAIEQLGMSGAALRKHTVETLFGVSLSALADLFRTPGHGALPLHLPGDRAIMAIARFEWTSQFRAGGTAADPDLQEAVRSSAAVASNPAGAEALARDAVSATGAAGSASATERPSAPAYAALERLRTGDPQVSALIDKIKRILDKHIPLMILGETGVGKELLARAVHADSVRGGKPFVAVNCASIPESLIEAELFGYEEGAFTGARKRGQAGRILQADGGTLFLDEIGDMPLPLQARLLRVLQERQVTPLGSQRSIAVDVNVICATHRNLRELIAEKAFREDLYYRLNGLTVRLPALRERTDLSALVRRILDEDCCNGHLTLSPAVTQLFKAYAWPGNIRQLFNVLRTACVMTGGVSPVEVAHLPDDFLEEARVALAETAAAQGRQRWAADDERDLSSSARASAEGRVHSPASSTADVAHASERQNGTAHHVAVDPDPVFRSSALPAAGDIKLGDLEVEVMRQTVEALGGNISEAAKRLGVSRNTIYRKLRWNAKATD